MKYHIPKNEMPHDELYVVLSRDEDGTEGIISAFAKSIALPMVFCNPKLVERVRPIIEEICNDTGRKLYLMKYKKHEQVEIIEPSN